MNAPSDKVKPSRTRKVRGMQTQRLVAAYYADHGFPHATDAGAGRPGRDILGVLGVATEVKARREFTPGAALRQAAATAGGDLPVVVVRLDGAGPATVADWPAFLRFADLVALMRRAGYGDPLDTATTEGTP